MWQNKHNFIQYTESNNDVYGSHHSVKDLFIPQIKWRRRYYEYFYVNQKATAMESVLL